MSESPSLTTPARSRSALSARPPLVPTNMAPATPRSLRSFLDAAPSDILDTPLTSLLMVPRADYEALLNEAQTLRKLLAEREDTPSNVAATIDAELQHAQTAALESKNDLLLKEKKELETAVTEAEAKSRAYKGEVTKLRTHLQRIQSAPNDTRKVQELENVNKGLQENVKMLQSENMKLIVEKNKYDGEISKLQEHLDQYRDLVPTAQLLGKNFDNLQSECTKLIEERDTLRGAVAQLTEENQKNQELQGRLRALEIEHAALEKFENDNKTLIAKNHDLAEDRSSLEEQVNSLQKEKVALGVAKETAEEQKRLLEREVKALRDLETPKTSAPTEPDKVVRYQLMEKSLQAQNARAAELQRYNNNLQQGIRELRRTVEELEEQNNALQTNLDRMNRIAHRPTADSRSTGSHGSDTLSQSGKRSSTEAFKKSNPEFSSQLENLKRLRLDGANASPDASKTSTPNKRGAIYLLDSSSVNVHNRELREAIKKTFSGIKIDSLRRAFIAGNVTTKWVVMFPHPVREFKKTIVIGVQVTATLTAPSGENCPICKITEHDIWDCPCLGEEGQELPGSSYTHSTPAGELPSFSHSDISLRNQFPLPSENRITHDRNIQVRDLVEKCHWNDRVVACKFRGFTPGVAQIAEIVCGGPVESFNMLEDKFIGFIKFVNPDNAANFLRYAHHNLNYSYNFERNTSGGQERASVVFVWSSQSCQDMDFEIATGIAQLGYTRVLELLDVPTSISAQQVASDCGTDRLFFWLREGQVVNGARNVFVEFESVQDSVRAYNSVRELGYGKTVRWGKEPCNRPVGPAMG